MYPDVTPRHCRWSLVAAKRPMHLNGTTALWPALHIKSESRTLSITSKVYLFKLVRSSDLVYLPHRHQPGRLYLCPPCPLSMQSGFYRYFVHVYPIWISWLLNSLTSNVVKLWTHQFIDKSPVLILCCYSASVAHRSNMSPCNGALRKHEKTQRKHHQ